MSPKLIACAHCHRHLFDTEASCPFCGIATARPEADPPGTPRLAGLVLAAAAAITAGAALHGQLGGDFSFARAVTVDDAFIGDIAPCYGLPPPPMDGPDAVPDVE